MTSVKPDLNPLTSLPACAHCCTKPNFNSHSTLLVLFMITHKLTQLHTLRKH